MVDSYRIEGRFIEACDCFDLCPCWADDQPDEGHCTGLVAWQVTQGDIDNVDVAGLSVVAVTGHGGGRREQRSMSVLFVDEGAGDDAFEKLGCAFSGQNGESGGRVAGPLGELAAVTGAIVAPPLRQKITITQDEDGWQICVGDEGNASAVVVASGRELRFDSSPDPLSLKNTALHTELQIQGEAVAQRGERLSLAVPALPGGYLEVQARSGMIGEFSYVHPSTSGRSKRRR